MKKKSCILITIDCLRADHLSCYGYKRKTSPFIDTLAKEGIIYKHAFSNGPFTIASFPSILASVYPPEFSHMHPLPKKVIPVSEILKKNEINTAAIHSNPFLSKIFGYDRGWDYFKDLGQSLNSRKSIYGVFNFLKNYIPRNMRAFLNYVVMSYRIKEIYADASQITNCAMSWIEANQDNSFFLWMHYMDAHEPYLKFRNRNYDFGKHKSKIFIAKSFWRIERGRYSDADLDSIIAIYDDAIRFIDGNIKNLINFIKGLNLRDILVIITADHGQQFFEHGKFGHLADFYDETIHVPLIIWGKKTSENDLVQNIDIPPTILSFFNITPPNSYKGKNLFLNHKTPFIISEARHNKNLKEFPGEYTSYAIRSLDWKYIFKFGREELYNLKKDPQESKNLIKKEDEIIKVFREELKKHLKEQKKNAEELRIKNKIKMLKSRDGI